MDIVLNMVKRLDRAVRLAENKRNRSEKGENLAVY